MDTKRIEALRAEMQGKYRMESVSVGTLSYLLDALLAPAASEPADLPVGFLADVSREVEERIAQRPEWQRLALEERLRRVEEQVKASESGQEPEPCVFGQESDCSCSKHRCPKCSGPGSSRTLPCVDCAQEPERCDGSGMVRIAPRGETQPLIPHRPCTGTGCHPVKCDAAGRHPVAPTPARGESPEAPDQHVGANIRGRCPACGFSSLFRGTAGYVTCSFLDCPDPGAAAKLMERDHAADQRELDDLRARLAATERNMNEHIADKHRILREYEAQAQVLRQKLAEANAYAEHEARTRRTIEKERDDAVSECGAAVVRAEAAERRVEELEHELKLINGAAGYIESDSSVLEAVQRTIRGWSDRCYAAERRVEELTATLQKMAEGPCWFDGDENVEWDADGRCSEAACFRCVAQRELAAAIAKGEKK